MLVSSIGLLAVAGATMHSSDVTVIFPNPLSVLFLRWLALRESGTVWC